jgi:hypothetical protein
MLQQARHRGAGPCRAANALRSSPLRHPRRPPPLAVASARRGRQECPAAAASTAQHVGAIGTKVRGCCSYTAAAAAAAAAARSRRVAAKAAGAGALSGDGAGGGAQQPAIGDAFRRVVLPTALALMVCNMDRICMSVAILPMSKEFGWPASLQVSRWLRSLSAAAAGGGGGGPVFDSVCVHLLTVFVHQLLGMLPAEP